MRKKGQIVTWKDEQGYGFIAPAKGAPELFVHISALNNNQRRPESGDVVSYVLSSDRQGRPRATKVRWDDESPFAGLAFSSTLKAFLTAILFLCVVTISVHSNALPRMLLYFYLVLSVITYLAFGMDKRFAKKGYSRVAENTLHLLSLVGGWPGALIAQYQFRHKTRKLNFRVLYWFAVVVNCSAFFWLYFRGGWALLEQNVFILFSRADG